MAYSTNSSAFKMPLAPPPPQPFQSETLLFNDILEEKTLALRDNLREFLQVFSYRKFDLEFSNFLKHTKQMVQEGQRAGANNSRIANSSHLVPMYSRPSGVNCRPPTTLSMINSTRNSTFRFPENNFQPIESSNPFKPPDNYNFQPRIVLPRVALSQLEQSNHIYGESPTLSATVVEVSQCTNVTTKTRNDRQSPELEERPQSTVPNSYSEVTLIENKAASDSQHNEDVDDGSNSIESILDNIGFKIVVGFPNSNEKTSNASNQQDKQLNFEKYLSMWSVTAKIINSNFKSSVVILSGTLLGDDKMTVLENRHDAGILESRKSNNLVKTTNGLYRLIGHLVGGSPNELYSACLAIHGIPRTWKHILKQLSEKTNKNAMLNFSLESPAGPTKNSVNQKTSVMVKNRSIHTKNINLTSQKNSGKRKYTEHNKTENNQFLEQSPSLLTSTPKRRKKQLTMFDIPSQILKNKFHANICNKAQSQTPKTINDSIKVTKKRQSDSKKRSSEFLKPPNTLVKALSSNNNSTKQSEQKSSVKNSMNNSMTTRSRSRLLETSFATFKENIVNKSKQAASERLASMSNSKTVNTKQKENIANCALSSREVKNKGRKKLVVESSLVKEKTKNLKIAMKKNTSQENKTKQKVVRKCSNDCLVVQRTDLFECLETSGGDDDDDRSSYNYNVMESPGKISLISRSDKSRSKTPLMFNLEMNTTTTKSLVVSEPPTPLSKSREAKALKRVKAPKITLKEEMKNNKINNNKQRMDCQAACKQINDMLEHGSSFDEYGD